ncbi:MAG: DUF1622 domain-containing protein [Pararhodobacter sp.]
MEVLFEYSTEGSILHTAAPWLITFFGWISAFINVAAVVLLTIGALRFIWGVAVAEMERDGPERVRRTNRRRVELARYILASLELFIAADIIHTAVSLAFADILFLGALVLIRSVISYFLERELEQVQKELNE